MAEAAEDTSFNIADFLGQSNFNSTGGTGRPISELLSGLGYTPRSIDFDSYQVGGENYTGGSAWDRSRPELSQEDQQYNMGLADTLNSKYSNLQFNQNNYMDNGNPMWNNSLTYGPNNKLLGSTEAEKIKGPQLWGDKIFPMLVKGFLGSMFAGAGVSAMGGGAAGGAGATNAALAESAVGGAGYGASSASSGGLLAGASPYVTQAAKGAVSGGINSGLGGGNVLTGALKGAAGGGLNAGIAQYNPAGMAGVTSPGLQSVFNRTLASGGNAAINGGDPKSSMLSSLLTGGLNYAGQEYFKPPVEGTTDMNDYGYKGAEFGDMSQFAGMDLANMGGYSVPRTENFDFNSPDSTSFYQPNPFENAFGDSFGGNMNNTPQNGQAQPGAQGGSPFMGLMSRLVGQKGGAGLGDMAGSLLGLYQANRQRRSAKDQANSLSAMFSQNSPYAATLRNQLNRRDAAGGRRSQYGPREVELQAKLAEMAGRNAPGQAAARSGQDQATMMMMNHLLNLGRKSGGFDSLAKMFSTGGN